ncbi:MAG: GTPase, partial [Candidatus Bathyarchaeia archaeon]
VGKSSLLRALTNAKVEVSQTPYTTMEPVPGMLSYEDIQLQLVEAPAVIEGASEGKAWGLQTLALARNADGLILMVDLEQDPIKQLSLLLGELQRARILVSKPRAYVEIEKKHMGEGLRIIVLGHLLGCTFKEVEGLLKSYGVTNALVKIYGEATLDEVEDAIFGTITYKPAIIVANKIDLKGAEQNLRLLENYVERNLKVVAVSCEHGHGVEGVGEALFKALELIRVYTKDPREREPSKKPFILKRGSTVQDLARNIHSDFIEGFLYANKIWSKRFSFSPQKVGAAFILEDGDIVEIHAR